MIVTADEIKTQDDLSIYGWELRLIQIEEDIAMLEKRKKEIFDIYLGLKERSEKRKQLSHEKSGDQDG